jgi:hypothetical protein
MSYTVVKIVTASYPKCQNVILVYEGFSARYFPSVFFTYLACLTGSILDLNFFWGGGIQIRLGCYFLIRHVLENALGPSLSLFVLKEVGDIRRYYLNLNIKCYEIFS